MKMIPWGPYSQVPCESSGVYRLWLKSFDSSPHCHPRSWGKMKSFFQRGLTPRPIQFCMAIEPNGLLTVGDNDIIWNGGTILIVYPSLVKNMSLGLNFNHGSYHSVQQIFSNVSF